MSKTRSRKARSLFASQWAELLIGIESSEKYAWKYRLGLYSEDFEYKDEWPMFSVNNGEVSSVQFSCSVVSNSDPMNRSMPTLWPYESQHASLPVHHQLPEFTQTHVHWVGDAIQPSHPLSSPSPPAPNPSQHQSLFQWVNSSHEVAKVLEFQL